jgi:hypothetical protein
MLIGCLQKHVLMQVHPPVRPHDSARLMALVTTCYIPSSGVLPCVHSGEFCLLTMLTVRFRPLNLVWAPGVLGTIVAFFSHQWQILRHYLN